MEDLICLLATVRTLKGGFFLETSIHKDPSSKQNFHVWYRRYNAPSELGRVYLLSDSAPLLV